MNWYNPDNVEISPVSHSGNNSLHFKSVPDRFIYVSQQVNFEKGFIYEIYAYVKFLDNITRRTLRFKINSHNDTAGFKESYSSRSYYRITEWKKICYKTGAIKKLANNSDPYLFSIYIYPSANMIEGYIDDISIERSNFIIGINNDLDEVYDNVNIVYRIYGDKETYNLNDFEIITRIKDDDSIYTEKKVKITSFSFTDSISINKLNLKDNNFYQVESTLKNKKDNVTDTSSYPFKKLKNKIKRNVTYDEYGRMFVNGELFFPLGISSSYTEDEDLKLINQTHFNIMISRFNDYSLNKIYSTFQGKEKVMHTLNTTPFYIPNPNTIKQKEENYKKYIVDKVNELKDHSTLLAWYINNEEFSYYHEDIRNVSLTVHELDPNHPTYSVIMGFREMPTLLNISDMFGLDPYPIGGKEIREVTNTIGSECEEPIGKPNIPCIQIFDWYALNSNSSGKPNPPTLQEMTNMCWQALAFGVRGFTFHSLYKIYKLDKITPIKDRWKDIVEFTDQIWKYKDVILSIDKVNKIEYVQNNNVTFGLRKYNNSNYIFVNNLEREKEIFKIDLLDKYNIYKEFGLGNIKKMETKLHSIMSQ